MNKKDILQQSKETFGTIKQAKNWLHTINIRLGNIKPVDLLNSKEGIEQIYKELIRIKSGAE